MTLARGLRLFYLNESVSLSNRDAPCYLDDGEGFVLLTLELPSSTVQSGASGGEKKQFKEYVNGDGQVSSSDTYPCSYGRNGERYWRFLVISRSVVIKPFTSTISSAVFIYSIAIHFFITNRSSRMITSGNRVLRSKMRDTLIETIYRTTT